MIAFRDDLPLIVLEDRSAVAFDPGWFTRALNVAACRAGYPQWWLAPHVTTSVKAWLQTLAERSALPAGLFMRAVREALKCIGYPRIGECFEASAPFSRILLVELAQRAGNGFELAFFIALGRKIGEMLRSGGSYCELHGLRQCVKVLRGQRTWSRGCAELGGEIVTFARELSSRACNATGGAGRELYLHVL